MHKFTVFAWILFSLAACQSSTEQTATFQPVAGGMEYKQLKAGVGDPVAEGNWLRLQVSQFFNDSVLFADRLRYQRYDSLEMTPESLQIFKEVRQGDSLVFRVRADSAFGSHPPPFAKDGGYLVTRVKIEKILRTEDEYRNDTTTF